MTKSPLLTGADALLMPADFGRRFVVFVDTEEEFDWSAQFTRAAPQTKTIKALPEATARLNGIGVQPIWLCDYPVIANPESAAIVQSMATGGNCWIGAHLHTWVTPPFHEALTVRNSFANNLPPDLEQSKLSLLTAGIQALIGKHPVIYRAGRYGIRAESYTALAALGYRVDTSVRPYFDYRQEGGPDFRNLPLTPWRMCNGIACLPMSAGFVPRFRAFPTLARTPLMKRLAAWAGLLLRCPLTPEGTPLPLAREVIALLDGEGLPLFNLSFHSPSLIPGHTPYVRSKDDLRRFWTWWDGVTEEFARRGIEPIDAAALIAALSEPSSKQ